MRKKILFLAGMMACCSLAGAQEISKTWVADKGNGTYQNPVLHADYSDPDVCAVVLIAFPAFLSFTPEIW